LTRRSKKARAQIERDEAAMALRRAAFALGERVTHPIFGAGTVVAVNAAEMYYSIQFDRLGTERAIQFGGILKRDGHGGASGDANR
jgi:hypothetical protein